MSLISGHLISLNFAILNGGSVNIFAHLSLCTWLLSPENELLKV